MLGMATEKPTRRRGRPANRTPTHTIHTAIDIAVGEALIRFMDAQPNGAKLKTVTERAYKMLLEAEGFWPPPAPEPAAKRGGK